MHCKTLIVMADRYSWVGRGSGPEHVVSPSGRVGIATVGKVPIADARITLSIPDKHD